MKKALTEASELFTVDEIAVKAKICPRTVRTLIATRELGHVRILRAVRVSVAQYNDWVRRNSTDAIL